MKNFLSFFSPKNLGEIAQTLWIRFPIPTVLTLVNAGFIWYQINHTSSTESDIIFRVTITLIVTFFLSVGVAIFGESHSNNKYAKWTPVLPVLYGICFYFSIRYIDINSGVFNDDIILFILHLVGFIAWIFFAPYLLRSAQEKKDVIQYTNYFTQVAWAFLMSGLIGGAVMALGSIAIGAVGTLFDVNDQINEWELYANGAVAALALAAPLHGLMHLPRITEVTEREYDTNKFFAFVIRFVIIPFVTLYFCILYAYSIKVLLNISDWPKGEVSWLVIGFSIFGYLGYMFSKSYEDGHTAVQIFRRFFPLVVIPQIPMLMYAIILRINQYDLTMNRYFVVIFGIWLTIISLYFVFGKVKSLTVIPATLAGIALLISIGPWGVYQLPLTRQYNRLISNLEKAEILRDGKISVASDTLDAVLENDIDSGIKYVCDFEKCARIKSLFSDAIREAEEIEKKRWEADSFNQGKFYPGMDNWTILSAISTHVGIEWRDTSIVSSEKKYLSYTLSAYDSLHYGMNIANYTTLYIIETYYLGNTIIEIMPSYVMVNIDKEELILKENNKETIFSLKDINIELIRKGEDSRLSVSDLTFVLTAGDRKIKIIFQSYAIKNPKFTGKEKSEFESIPSISGYALVK